MLRGQTEAEPPKEKKKQNEEKLHSESKDVAPLVYDGASWVAVSPCKPSRKKFPSGAKPHARVTKYTCCVADQPCFRFRVVWRSSGQITQQKCMRLHNRSQKERCPLG